MYILNTCTRTTTVKCQMRRLPFRSSSIWDLHITNACVHSAFTTHTHVRASIHHTHTHKFSTTSIREVVSFLTPFFIFLTQNKGQMFNTYRPALNSVGKIFPSAVLPSTFVTPHCAVDRIFPNSTELCRTTCDSHVSCIL